MSIVSVQELIESRTATFEMGSKREYSRNWLVRVDSRDDGPATVSSSTDIPIIGSYYTLGGSETDITAILKTKSISRVSDDGLLWRVSGSYSTEYDSPENEPPLSRATRISVSIIKQEVVADKDVNGEAITNSAGAPFDPPPTKVEPIVEIVFTKNVDTYDINLALQYVETINAETFYGIPRHHAKCEEISWSEERYEAGEAFREQRIVILARNDSWQPRYLDHGMYEYDNAGGYVVLEDANGQPISAPMNLDGHGNVLDAGMPPVFLDETELYEDRSFSLLPI